MKKRDELWCIAIAILESLGYKIQHHSESDDGNSDYVIRFYNSKDRTMSEDIETMDVFLRTLFDGIPYEARIVSRSRHLIMTRKWRPRKYQPTPAHKPSRAIIV